jgi:hypothetical protein
VLTLRDVTDHPLGASALEELRRDYDIREVAGGLQLIQRDADLRLYLYEVDDILGAARRNAQRDRQPKATNGSDQGEGGNRYGPEDIISGAADLASARRAIAQLEEQVLQLRVIGRIVADQREKWKLRAQLAELKLSRLKDTTTVDPGDQRYGALRRFLAKRFHPDHAPGTGIEKLVRSEIFKEIWSEVGRIEGR